MSPPLPLARQAARLMSPPLPLARQAARFSALPAAVLAAHDAFLFDCDGVIWKASRLCDARIGSVLRALQEQHGKRALYVTNSTMATRRQFLQKFRQLGLDESVVKLDQIYTAASAAARWVSVNLPRLGPGGDQSLFLIGAPGVEAELKELGVRVIGGPSDKEFHGKAKSFFEKHFGSFGGTCGEEGCDSNVGKYGCSFSSLPEEDLPRTRKVGAVMVGFDPLINYYKINYAHMCLSEEYGFTPAEHVSSDSSPKRRHTDTRKNACAFLATNPDRVAHLTPDQEWVGCGGMLGAVQRASGRDPTVLGKPGPTLIEMIRKDLSAGKDSDSLKMCMVGDRLDTDIEFGNRYGLTTLLVTSGVTSEAELEHIVTSKDSGDAKGGASVDPLKVPDYVLPGLGDFFG